MGLGGRDEGGRGLETEDEDAEWKAVSRDSRACTHRIRY